MSVVTKPMARRATKENYVNNKEFLDALMVYRQQVAVAIESDKTKPRIPNYIGECF